MQHKLIEVDPIPNDLLCSICRDLIMDPVTCVECVAANFCSKCAKSQISKHGRCPCCQTVMTPDKVQTSLSFLKSYDAYEMKCTNNGCVWKGIMKEYLKHREICSVECPLKNFGCKWIGDIDRLQKVHSKECFYLNSKQEIYPKTRFFSPQCMLISIICLAIFFLVTWWQSYMWNGQRFPNYLNDREKRDFQEQISVLATRTDILKIIVLTKLTSTAFVGIFQDIPYSYFLYSGFKLGLNTTFSSVTSYYDITQNFYQRSAYVLIGARKTGDTTLILAALGKGMNAFSSTYGLYTCNPNNGVYWYLNSGKSFGFSLSPDVYLNDIDVRNDELNSYRIMN